MSEPIQNEESTEKEYSFTPEKGPVAAQNPHAAPPPPASPPQPQRIRRVGTITMGLSLIAAGITALICLFAPSFDIFTILRFSPLVLIFLGVEVLVSNVVFRNDRIKYDFWSGVICFLLICASVGMAILPPLFTQYGPARERLREEMVHQTETLCYQALQNEKDIQSLRVNLYLHGGASDYQDATVQSISSFDDLYLSFSLLGDYAAKEQFAEKAHSILGRLSALPVVPSRVSFYYEDSSGEKPRTYQLELGGAFALRQDANGLAKMVQEGSEWDRIEEERQMLGQERERLYNELEQEREQLVQEREEARQALSQERETLYQELEEQREQLEQDREQMNEEYQQRLEELQEQQNA